ncbi:MAG: DNA internalization-related competence protein ComEC/Rec2 [Sedimentisphaerales bacterium]|nr:DNA internalization-related competence protein ComEC/Rec2 [Sedimentisphaerales bacterium]
MDEIKRKLAAIETQLAGYSLHDRVIATAPLLFVAVGLMTGIVLQSVIGSPYVWVWVVLLVLCVTAVCVYALLFRRAPHPRILAYAAALCFLCLGAIRLTAFTEPASNDVRRFVGPDRVLATLRGRVLTQPSQQQQDWWFAEFTFSDPSTTFHLGLEQAQTTQGWETATGTVRVHVDEPTLNLNAGDRIQFHCWLHRFEGPTNPGQFDVAAYLARRNIYVGASVPSRDAIEPFQSGRQNIITRLRGWLSQAVSQALLDGMPDGAPAQGLLQALLLGNRQDIDRDTYEAFRKTGLLHFISLSGLHLGIFVWMIWWLSKIAGLAKPHRALVCIIATAMFLLVVPPRAPTVRAAVIVWAYCLALILRRRTNPLNSLCLAAVILLLIRPTQLFEAGWQLSFAAVAGILALTGMMQDFIPNKPPAGARHSARFIRVLSKSGIAPARLLATGVAAWVGGAGILLYHFFTITPLTAIWTVLVFPLVGVILLGGFAKVVLFFFLPSLSNLLGLFVSSCANLLIWVVKLIAGLEINTILIGHVALWVPICYYGLVLLATFVRTRHVVLKKWLCVAWAFALVAYLGALKWQRTHRDDLRLTVLDVGHGQAILAQLPGTKNILLDAGSLYTPDVGSRIVVPFLDYIGVGRIHAIIISHNDIDHINGIPEIVSAKRVGHVWANEAFLTGAPTGPTSQHLIECLLQRGHRMEPVPGTLQAGHATVSTLWPADDPSCPADLSDNDRSLVSLIEFAAARVLLCSDIEQFAQQQILARHPHLHAKVVVCPHHGSPTTLDQAFIETLEPEILICSGSRSDYERRRGGPLAPSARQLHTGRNGAITVCVEASDMVNGNIQVRTFKGE